MAVYRAVANGNWSSLSTWQDNSTGSFVASTTLPGAADNVYANNFTVQVNVSSITINLLSNNLITGVSNLGRFELAINCNITCLSGIEGQISTAGAINNPTSATLYVKSAVTLSITGDMYSGTQGRYAVAFDATSNVTIVGNQYGRINVNTTAALLNTGSSTFNIIGNQYGGSGSTSNTSVGINNLGSASFIITGNQYGGANTTASGITTTAGSLIITGNQQASSGPAIILSSTASTLSIIGNCYAAANNAIIVNSFNSQVTYQGSIYNVSGVTAIFSPKLFLNPFPNTVYQFQDYSGVTNTLYSPDSFPGTPPTIDVKNGVIYGVGGSLIGQLDVPPPSAVAVGVPVDGTFGTAMISITDMGALLASYNI